MGRIKDFSWITSVVIVFSYFLVTDAQRSQPGVRPPPPEETGGHPGDRLVLTPFLNNGSAREGRELARVKNMASTESYSGFLIANDTYNSNIFFWFFPAQVDSRFKK